jgi:hypothetical protein
MKGIISGVIIIIAQSNTSAIAIVSIKTATTV